MSTGWEDELDIDDSDIQFLNSKSIFSSETPTAPFAKGRTDDEDVGDASIVAAASNAFSDIASCVLKRFQKPSIQLSASPSTLQHRLFVPSRQVIHHDQVAAYRSQDEIDLDPVPKRHCGGPGMSGATKASSYFQATALKTPGFIDSNNPSLDAAHRKDSNRSDMENSGLGNLCLQKERQHLVVDRQADVNGREDQKDRIRHRSASTQSNFLDWDNSDAQPVDKRENHSHGGRSPDVGEDVVNSAGRMPSKIVLGDYVQAGNCATEGSAHQNSANNSHISMKSLHRDLPYLIPGPAGAVQQALCLKTNQTFTPNMRKKGRIEYIRQVLSMDDADFSSGPWLLAMDHIKKNSMKMTSITSIKVPRTENRVSKLVAFINICTSNGCGDVSVTVKDLSDSIAGTVNRRVMSETEFGRLIEPGAVILLQQVAVFSPTPFSHYLNITINNVEQVFGKSVQVSKGECSHVADKGKCHVNLKGDMPMPDLGMQGQWDHAKKHIVMENELEDEDEYGQLLDDTDFLE